ncbi:MAG TPA: hypothetical protein VJX67_11290 [Blastocatellia bacterium]|nr:hypothetical protein [Blastocatellia bacterium]
MPLSFNSGERFATGAVRYLLTRRNPTHLTTEVEIAGHKTEAILDTGAPYLICSPELSEQLSLDPADALQSLEILIRGARIGGGLHRVELILLATAGASLSIEATAFVPDARLNFGVNHPSFIGYIGCLERLRFAIDPQTERFYFGRLSSTLR